MPCITIQFDQQKRMLLMQVGLRKPASLSPPDTKPPDVQTLVALVDTGATQTCIVQSVAESLELPLMGKGELISASHRVSTNTYLGDFYIPFGKPGQGSEAAIQSLQLIAIPQGGDTFQLLLGMDVLCAGLFQMVGYDSRFTFCL